MSAGTRPVKRTNLGYEVWPIHPMAAQGYKYRFTTVSGWVHIDEYVAPFGVWVYMGTVKS